MRLSTLIAKCEDAVLRNTPKAKRQALRTTHRAASWLSAKAQALADRIDTDEGPGEQPGAPDPFTTTNSEAQG